MPTLGEPPVPPKVRAYDEHRRLGPNKLTCHAGHPLAGLHVQNAVNLGIRLPSTILRARRRTPSRWPLARTVRHGSRA